MIKMHSLTKEADERKNTCQICARPILANTGLIAHHGYQRPGGGWQTKSCAGARHLPYEESCDMLPPTIEAIKAYIIDRNIWLNDFIDNPPDKLLYKEWSSDREFKEAARPDNFDPLYDYGGFRHDQHYEYRHHSIVYETGKDIIAATRDLEFMIERLKNWIGPKGEKYKGVIDDSF